jgi:hypothetical protein
LRIKQLVCFLSGWSAYFGSTPTRDEKSQLAPPSTCFGSRARFPPPAPSGKQSKKKAKEHATAAYRLQATYSKAEAPCTTSTAHRPRTGPLLYRTSCTSAVDRPHAVCPPRTGRRGCAERCWRWARGPHGQRTKGRERPRNKRAPREKFGGNSSCSLHSTPLPRSRSVGGRTKPPDSLVPRPGPPRPSSILLLACGCGQPL